MTDGDLAILRKIWELRRARVEQLARLLKRPQVGMFLALVRLRSEGYLTNDTVREEPYYRRVPLFRLTDSGKRVLSGEHTHEPSTPVPG